MIQTVICRKASTDDIDAIYELIQGYASQGIMLPRSKETLRRQIDTFLIAEWEGRLVGCGSLTRLGDDLVEIRSLGLHPEYKGRGIGRTLVESLVQMAKEQGFTKVMALTYEAAFFEKNGFSIVSKEIFPEKVWTDCMHCPKQDHCDEIAVLKTID